MQAISLFSGAGGMDIGFKRAGFETIWANDFDPVACETFKANNLGDIECGDFQSLLPDLKKFKGIELLYGGPPCQGFSVAGKMDPDDERSRLLHSFISAVDIVRPQAFVMENVKALATLSRWEELRKNIIKSLTQLGYTVELLVLNATEFGVPQKRERMFLVGFLKGSSKTMFSSAILKQKNKAMSVRQALSHLGPAGSSTNLHTCNAEITLAAKPIMRKSPYAGMIFNGAGRPVHIDGYALTLPASMGGNKTPIIDENVLQDPKASNWIEEYHAHLRNGGAPYDWKSAPKHLRRLTVDEALALQTFPKDFILTGKKSAWYRMIGNAVPCNLAYSVASAVRECLQSSKEIYQDQAA